MPTNETSGRYVRPGTLLDTLVAQRLGVPCAYYSTDLGQAWWLLARLPGVSIGLQRHVAAGLYACIEPGPDDLEATVAWGETPAHAICLAALKYAGVPVRDLFEERGDV